MPKKRKPRVYLDHEQKRQVAKQVVAGRLIKQVAAEWCISLDCAHKIVQEYTVVARSEKFPLDDVREEAYNMSLQTNAGEQSDENPRDCDTVNADCCSDHAGVCL